MSRTERLTISLPADMVATLKEVVEQGDYPCASSVIYEALHEWKMKRAVQMQELAALRADIQKGMDDIAAGRTYPFDPNEITRRGRELLRKRTNSGKD
jgi:Predicted transcriptional regulators containing the CopG/Arc/MetJ DNA-binding domain